MATSLLRTGRLSHVKSLHAGSWITLTRAPAAGAFSTKSGGPKKPTKSPSTDKKQPKTYFDLEKLIQHKSYKFPKTEVSSAVAAAAAVSTTPSTADVKTTASVLEATETTSTIIKPVLAAEATPAEESVSESALAGKATFEAEVIAEPIQTIQPSEPIVEVASVAEAATKIVAEVEDVGGPSVEAAASTTDTTGSGAKLTCVEVSAEAVPEILSKAIPFEDVQKTTVEPAPTEISLESMHEGAPIEVAPFESISEAVFVESTLKSKAEGASPKTIFDCGLEVSSVKSTLAETTPVEPTLKSVAEVTPVGVTLEPVAEAPPADMTLKPLAEAPPADVTLESLAEAAPVEPTLEPVAEAAMEPVTNTISVEPTLEPMPEPVVEASPAVFTLEPMDEAAMGSDAETASMESAPELWAKASEAAAEISVTKKSSTMIDPALVLPEAAGEELQMEATAEPVEPSEALMDPVQKLFLDSIRQYSTKSQAAGGLVDADADYQKTLAQEVAKLQRLYGGGDLTSFPEFKFNEPQLDENSLK